MKFAYFRIVVFLTLVVVCHSAYGQDSLRFRYGISGGVSANMHIADFRALPGVPNCCPEFTSGSGTGLFAGIDAEWPIASQWLFSLGLNYEDQSANLQHNETVGMIVNGSFVVGTDAHTLNATLRSIGVQPMVAYRLFGGAFLEAGMRGGYMITKQYSQEERIAGSSGTFLDSAGNDSHSQIRDQSSGAIPQAASFIGQVVGGVRYELPLNADHTLFLVPNVSCAVSLTNVSAVSWKPNAVLASIGITFSPKPNVYYYDTTIERDTIQKLDRNIAARTVTRISRDSSTSVAVAGNTITTATAVREHYLLQIPDPHDVRCSVTAVELEDDDSTEHPLATLKIEEFLSMNAHPLLGYVFFGEGDSIIPARYHLIDRSHSSHYDLHALFSLDALGIHHDALNIIATRLKTYPHAHLTITGCNANSGIEAADTMLSAARARTIYNYFHEVWNIPAAQMSLVVRNLPDKPSNPRTPLGMEENRRVELTCDVPEVLDVFIANDTTRIPNPPQLRFKLNTASSVGITSWSLDVKQGDKVIHHTEGSGEAPAAQDWDITHDYAAIPHFGIPLHIILRTINSKGDAAVDSTILPTQVLTVQEKRAKHTSDVIIDRYNLVLFDFARSTTLPAHERILNLVRSRLETNSSIVVEGYTDKTGTPAGNKRLATERATSSAKTLGRADAVIKGVGDTRLLYPNDTPEGRFLCRTVQITVRTAVK